MSLPGQAVKKRKDSQIFTLLMIHQDPLNLEEMVWTWYARCIIG